MILVILNHLEVKIKKLEARNEMKEERKASGGIDQPNFENSWSNGSRETQEVGEKPK